MNQPAYIHFFPVKSDYNAGEVFFCAKNISILSFILYYKLVCFYIILYQIDIVLYQIVSKCVCII